MELVNFHNSFSFYTQLLSLNADSRGVALINYTKLIISIREINDGLCWELFPYDHFINFNFDDEGKPHHQNFEKN